MTLEEAKDSIAATNGKQSWNAWGHECSESYGREIPNQYLEQAALLYAKSKWEEASKETLIDLSKTLINKVPEDMPDNIDAQTKQVILILSKMIPSYPIPEFKP